MPFIKEYRKNIKGEFLEWEYLTKIGVRDMFDKPISDSITELVIDREKNYFLIPQVHTNINRDDREINYYALCLDGVVLNMEVTKRTIGSGWYNNYECFWDIEKIKFPANWNYGIIKKKELIEIIKEAFITETYSRSLTVEKVKSIVVKVSAVY